MSVTMNPDTNSSLRYTTRTSSLATTLWHGKTSLSSTSLNNPKTNDSNTNKPSLQTLLTLIWIEAQLPWQWSSKINGKISTNRPLLSAPNLFPMWKSARCFGWPWQRPMISMKMERWASWKSRPCLKAWDLRLPRRLWMTFGGNMGRTLPTIPMKSLWTLWPRAWKTLCSLLQYMETINPLLSIRWRLKWTYLTPPLLDKVR